MIDCKIWISIASLLLLSGCNKKQDLIVLGEMADLKMQAFAQKDDSKRIRTKVEVSNLSNIPRHIECELLLKDRTNDKLISRKYELNLYPKGTHELLLGENEKYQYEVVEILSLQTTPTTNKKICD